MRHKEHLSPLTGPFNPGFWDAYQRLGTPDLIILETIESEDSTALIQQLNALETRYIYLEKATEPEYGYNRRIIATTSCPDIGIHKKEYAIMLKEA